MHFSMSGKNRKKKFIMPKIRFRFFYIFRFLCTFSSTQRKNKHTDTTNSLTETTNKVSRTYEGKLKDSFRPS